MTDLDKLIEAVERGEAWAEYFSKSLAPMSSRDAIKAYFHGSLDAAKALHEALLPGWFWTIGDIEASVSKHQVWITEHSGGGAARAWLLAILKAYRSLQ